MEKMGCADVDSCILYILIYWCMKFDALDLNIGIVGIVISFVLKYTEGRW